MLNYTLNKEKAKTFVKYYKENDDKIEIHYADNSTLEVDNNYRVKAQLDRIQEQQLENYLERDGSKSIGYIIAETVGGIGTALFVMLFFTGILGGLGAICFGIKSFAVVGAVSSLILLEPIVEGIRDLTYKMNSLKFDLFMKYKNKINNKIDKENVENEKNIKTNTVNMVKPKVIKNLCINDVNFMNYFQVKKMAKEIDKEEKELEIARQKEEINNLRYHALGIDKPKSLEKKLK